MLRRTAIFILMLAASPVCLYGQQFTGSGADAANQASTQAVHTLTLQEVLQRALLQASPFRQAQISELIAGEELRQARTAFLPKITTQNSYIYTTPGPRVPGETMRQPSFIANNAINEYIAQFNISGDLDTSRRLLATLERDRAALAAARVQTEVARKGLSLSVVDAYFGLSLARGNRVVAQDTLSAAEDFLRITQLLFSGGEIAEADVIKARIQVSTRRIELSRSLAAEFAAEDSLRVLINANLNEPIDVQDISLALPVATIDLNSYTEQLIRNRPELAGFEAQTFAARQDIKIARSDLLPQMSYSLQVGLDDATFSFWRDRGAAFSVSLKFPVFDWGAIRSRERQARLRLRSLELERELAMRNFLQQFYTARANVASAIDRMRISSASIADARRSLSLAIARYRAGEAPILEVTDAQNTLASERAAYYQAIFDYQTSLARLEQAVGR